MCWRRQLSLPAERAGEAVGVGGLDLFVLERTNRGGGWEEKGKRRVSLVGSEVLENGKDVLRDCVLMGRFG